MQIVSLFEAKTHLSRLVEQIATGAETEIVISRNGKPVARVLPIQPDASRRIGIARGEFEVPDDIDAHNAEVAALFAGRR
ncbi:MAG: type II toxin-antitoxin system prevent-host-death family antitoxin [Rhodocyclaceae bacterium]|nr:type II toxin-antitoxin system prevent-host-death family antitoxin [Rhodocyclaceae bacterium]